MHFMTRQQTPSAATLCIFDRTSEMIDNRRAICSSLPAQPPRSLPCMRQQALRWFITSYARGLTPELKFYVALSCARARHNRIGDVSVCLSVTRWYSVKTNNRRITWFSQFRWPWMTLNACNTRRHTIFFSGTRSVELSEDRPILSAAKLSPGSIDFSHVQTAHKLAGWVTPNPDCKGTPLFDFK